VGSVPVARTGEVHRLDNAHLYEAADGYRIDASTHSRSKSGIIVGECAGPGYCASETPRPLSIVCFCLKLLMLAFAPPLAAFRTAGQLCARANPTVERKAEQGIVPTPIRRLDPLHSDIAIATLQG
jgi:hypothetical protein